MTHFMEWCHAGFGFRPNLLKQLSCLIVIAGIALMTGLGYTHPLGNFSINRYSCLEPGIDELVIYYVVDMAEIAALQEKGAIDTDQNGEIDKDESSRYLDQKAEALRLGLSVQINEKPARLEIIEKEISYPTGQGGLPTLRMELTLIAPLPPFSSARPLRISYVDSNYGQRLGWREVVARAGKNVELAESNVPRTGVSRSLSAYPQEMLYDPLNVSAAQITVVPGSGAVTVAPRDPIRIESGGHKDDRFTRLIKTQVLTPQIVLFALVASFGLGAFHALSPGHGKSIVAAYLVGSRGTLKHAAFLGATVTLTHTFGVFALGLITLYASRFILPEALYPWLSFGSGIVVFLIGTIMLVKRIQAARKQNPDPDFSHQDQGHAHDSHFHHAHHDHKHPHAGHNHSQANPDRWTPFHHHPHDHDHDHGHSHLPPGADGSPVTWRSLLALGITGGILPCPSALVVLLAAISLQRIGFGMILILAFSLGLATVLTVIGMAFVKARQLLNRVPTAGPVLKSLPVASAFVIMLLGAGITLNAFGQIP